MLRMRDVRSSRVRLVRFFQRLPFAGTVWDKRGWQENAKDKPLLCKGFARGGRKPWRKLQDQSRNCWERDFFGGLMLSVLVSWRAGCVETMGVKC